LDLISSDLVSTRRMAAAAVDILRLPGAFAIRSTVVASLTRLAVAGRVSAFLRFIHIVVPL
jgi:hypothetical protein